MGKRKVASKIELEVKCNELMSIKDDIEFIVATKNLSSFYMFGFIDSLGDDSSMKKAIFNRIRKMKTLWKNEEDAKFQMKIYDELKQVSKDDPYMVSKLQKIQDELKVELNNLETKRN